MAEVDDGWPARALAPSELFASRERHLLSRWRKAARDGVIAYCEKHGIRTPNRITTVQPAGTKSLLTGASSGWHPHQRLNVLFVVSPLASMIPWYPLSLNTVTASSPLNQHAMDDGNLLDDIADPSRPRRSWLKFLPK